MTNWSDGFGKDSNILNLFRDISFRADVAKGMISEEYVSEKQSIYSRITSDMKYNQLGSHLPGWLRGYHDVTPLLI